VQDVTRSQQTWGQHLQGDRWYLNEELHSKNSRCVCVCCNVLCILQVLECDSPAHITASANMWLSSGKHCWQVVLLAPCDLVWPGVGDGTLAPDVWGECNLLFGVDGSAAVRVWWSVCSCVVVDFYQSSRSAAAACSVSITHMPTYPLLAVLCAPPAGGKQAGGWFYGSNDALCHDRHSDKHAYDKHAGHGPWGTPGAVIDICLDMDARELWFGVNGAQLKLGFTGLPARVQPAVSVRAPGQLLVRFRAASMLTAELVSSSSSCGVGSSSGGGAGSVPAGRRETVG
jgi:hypothetical protein